jgi:hypothetical protein
MPDDLNNQSAPDVKVEGEASQAGADLNKPDATDGGTEETTKGQEDPQPTDGVKTESPKEGEDTTKKDDDDNQEPATRTRLAREDFIIARQKAKLAKKREEQKDEGQEEVDESEVAPEDEEMITKVVAKRFAPIIDKSIAADDDKEINDFLTENPDFKTYEAKVRRFMSHPSRRSLPIKSIFYEVAGDNLLKMGAERARLADQKAKATQTGGGSNRAKEGATNDWTLSQEEFQAKQERIRRGQ